MKKYPEHFKLPTDGVLRQYVAGREAGLVDVDHWAAKNPVETIPVDDIRSREVRGVLAQMYKTARLMNAAGYRVAGLDATQIGESVRCALVPHETDKDRFMAVINGKVTNQSKKLGPIVPHGCHYSGPTFYKARVPESHTLQGYNWKGEPLGEDGNGIYRDGFKAVVDVHEILWHENQLRPPDIAIAVGDQIDHRTPEMKEEYRVFFDGADPKGNPNDPNAFKNNPDILPDWPDVYDPRQWWASVAGYFALRDFVQQR